MAEIQKNKHVNEIHCLFIFIILLSLIFSSALPAGAAESDTGSYFSDDYIQGIINSTPAVGPALFEQSKSAENTIAASGIVPVLAEGRESYEWFISLQNVVEKVNNEGTLAPYHWDNGGFIIGYGCIGSHIQISVYSEAAYSDEDINAVIQIIQDAGKTYDIVDAPLIIESSKHAQGYEPEPAQEGQEGSAPPDVPGVGLTACVVLSLIAVFFIRKFKK